MVRRSLIQAMGTSSPSQGTTFGIPALHPITLTPGQYVFNCFYCTVLKQAKPFEWSKTVWNDAEAPASKHNFSKVAMTVFSHCSVGHLYLSWCLVGVRSAWRRWDLYYLSRLVFGRGCLEDTEVCTCVDEPCSLCRTLTCFICLLPSCNSTLTRIYCPPTSPPPVSNNISTTDSTDTSSTADYSYITSTAAEVLTTSACREYGLCDFCSLPDCLDCYRDCEQCTCEKESILGKLYIMIPSTFTRCDGHYFHIWFHFYHVYGTCSYWWDHT